MDDPEYELLMDVHAKIAALQIAFSTAFRMFERANPDLALEYIALLEQLGTGLSSDRIRREVDLIVEAISAA